MSKSSDSPSKKVFCVTLNTAIDYIIEVDELDVGTTIRSTGVELVPAGKGVDVAVGVAALGGAAIATGFVGEQSREMFTALKAEHLTPMFIGVSGRTRINVTVLEQKLARETHLQTTGYNISQTDVEHLRTVLEDNVNRNDVVVIGGSLPPKAPDGLAGDLVTLCRSLGAYVILDSSGPALLNALRANPHMVKPNLLELGQIVDRKVDGSDDGVLAAAQECLSLGVRRVVVSRGYRGIVVVEDGRAWKAWLECEIRQDTAGVGSGDALVAAMAFCALRDSSIEEAMRLGVACGAANLLTRLPGRFHPEDVSRLLRQARVKRVL